MASTSQHRCVFVGNIPYDATEEQLVQICEEVGPVVSFRLVLDRETGKPKGYGFCEYKDEETALSARRNLQGYEINGRQLRVDFAENDKGTDRTRGQGRGGPGLTSNIDAQKSSAAPPVLSGSTIHQPIGQSIAANAASIMAGSLGAVQTSSMPGFQNQVGIGNDPLTHHIAKMSKSQLCEIMSEMKNLAIQDKVLAGRLLQTCPQLLKALFQAQIMLGLVPQHMLQMPHLHQSASSLGQPKALSDGQAVILPHNAQPSTLQNVPQVGAYSRPQALQQNPLLPVIPQQVPTQSRIPPQEAHPHPVSQGPTLSKYGFQTTPQILPASLSKTVPAPSRPAKEGSVTVQPLLQQHRPATVPNLELEHHPLTSFQNTTIQNPALSLPSQNGSSGYHVSLSGLPKASGGAVSSSSFCYIPTEDSTTNFQPNSVTTSKEKVRKVNDAMELTDHPSKLPRLEDGSRHPQIISSNTFGASTQGSISSLGSAGKLANSDGQLTENQSPQLLPEAEAALLKQVLSLTSEQLSSLPPDQRQQVIQLQQMLRGQ